MKSIGWIVVLAITCATPAAAQSRRVYLGTGTAAELGSRGSVDVGAVGAVGLLAGLRLSGGWSVEFGVDRGFGASPDRVSEGLILVQIDRLPTREEREHLGVFGRTIHSQSTGTGYSALVVWRTRDPHPVNAAFFGGVSGRGFHRRRVQTITRIGPGVTYPPDHPNLQNTDETIHRPGAGLTAGFLVPIRLAPALHLAPEVSATFGLMSDGSNYRACRARAHHRRSPRRRSVRVPAVPRVPNDGVGGDSMRAMRIPLSA